MIPRQLKKNSPRGLLALLAFSLCIGSVSAQAQEADTDTVVATVGDTEIFSSRIQRYLKQLMGSRELSEQQLQRLRTQALEHFVKRELVNHYLKARNFQAGPNQIKLEIEELTANLERVGRTLKKHLEERGQTKADLENEVAWRICWDAYLEKTLTDEVLKSYYERRRRRFDGTEIRVAQILFRTLGSQESTDAAIQLATQVQKQLELGELTWDAAVKANSIAASKDSGGDLGWIRYKEPMPIDFTRRAFELDAGQMAEPFASSFGVHLVKCLEVRAGKSEFGDVRSEVESAATKELFERLSNRQLSEVKVTYADGWK